MNVTRANEVLGQMCEAMWSAGVKTKWHPPEGFFEQSAAKIASGLKKASDSLEQAMSRLNFYINRAGKNLGSKDVKRLEAAKKKLQGLYGESMGEGLRSRGGRWVKTSKKKGLPKKNGKEISFAELDGPHTTGPGGRGDFERGEFAIVLYDKDDREIDTITFRDGGKARGHLKRLASQGVEVSSMTGA